MMRYKEQTGSADLSIAGTKDFAINPENTPVENIALWIVTPVVCVWTLSALVNGVAITLGTGNTTTGNKPTKVFSEAGPYPLSKYPLSLNINNSTSGAVAHVEFVFDALIRNAFA